MAHGRARDERKARQWQRWIDQWRSSGLSVRAFCARHGLTTASFYNWPSNVLGVAYATGEARRLSRLILDRRPEGLMIGDYMLVGSCVRLISLSILDKGQPWWLGSAGHDILRLAVP